MNKTHSFYKNFNDLQSKIAYLKSVKKLRRNLNVIQLRFENGVLLICCLSLKLFKRTVWLLQQKYTNVAVTGRP